MRAFNAETSPVTTPPVAVLGDHAAKATADRLQQLADRIFVTRIAFADLKARLDRDLPQAA